MQRRTSRTSESPAWHDLELVGDTSRAPGNGEASQRDNDKGSTSATNQALISGPTGEDTHEVKYLTGWRFYFLTVA